MSCAILGKVASQTLGFFICKMMLTTLTLQGLWCSQQSAWPTANDAQLMVAITVSESQTQLIL